MKVVVRWGINKSGSSCSAVEQSHRRGKSQTDGDVKEERFQ